MDLILIIIGVVTVLAVLFFVGGYVVAPPARRALVASTSPRPSEALEAAWAHGQGLGPRAARPGRARGARAPQARASSTTTCTLSLVDDRPGVAEDKAHFVCTGEDGEARVVLARDADGEWRVDSVS